MGKSSGKEQGLPEILGVGEDHSNIPKRTDGGPSPSAILSVYLKGGPKYLLGKRLYRFEAPAAILIPKGTVDIDRQEGRVNGIFILFQAPGLLRKPPGKPGREVIVRHGGVRRAFPCLKELASTDAERIASTIAEIGASPTGSETGRLRQTSLLLRAIAEYGDADSRTGKGRVHREAARLHELTGKFAFENIPMARIYDKLEISAAHAETLFLEAYGVSPVAHRRRLRLRRARELLVSSAMNVSEVAYAVGFTDPLYFSKVFRSAFGMAPSSLIRDFSAKRK